MKNFCRVFVCIALTAVLFLSCEKQESSQKITISGAWALYPLCVRWQEEYGALKPGSRLEISAGGAGKGMSDVLAGLADIAMVSRDISDAEAIKGATAFVIAKDAVLPAINVQNPVIRTLRRRGLTAAECRVLWVGKSVSRWIDFPGFSSSAAINVYTRSDACGAGQVWAEFLHAEQDDLIGVQVNGDPGIAEAVIRDPNGIGYNNIGFAYDAKTLQSVRGLEILKIDFNANGKIDPDEDVYETRATLMAAIMDGRFPSPPARYLYFVTRGVPADRATRDFLQWVLTHGQVYVEDAGYIRVAQEVLNAGLKLIRAE